MRNFGKGLVLLLTGFLSVGCDNIPGQKIRAGNYTGIINCDSTNELNGETEELTNSSSYFKYFFESGLPFSDFESIERTKYSINLDNYYVFDGSLDFYDSFSNSEGPVFEIKIKLDRERFGELDNVEGSAIESYVQSRDQDDSLFYNFDYEINAVNTNGFPVIFSRHCQGVLSRDSQ
jgi:hypothetical protein